MQAEIVETRFIETEKFPVEEVNEASRREKKFGGYPPVWELLTWWSRKPYSGARAVIAACLLPADVSAETFKRIVRLDAPPSQVHRLNPRIPAEYAPYFRNAKVLDPFAGFGSIPFEAMRLGVGEVVAVDLLPVAYIALKAVLEYPRKYGNRLMQDVERWGRWVVDKLRRDPVFSALFEPGVPAYIVTWEIVCPKCGRRTPLLASFWLSRPNPASKKEIIGNTFAWLEPVDGKLTIRVVEADPSNVVYDKEKGTLKVGDTVYTIPKPNVAVSRGKARCLWCGAEMNRKPGEEWLVKAAMREWFMRLEAFLRGEISIEELKDAPARPIVLFKIVNAGKRIAFLAATEEDQERMWRTYEMLRERWGDVDFPMERLWEYRSKSGGGLSIYSWGINRFYKFFTARPLLALYLLVKYVRAAGFAVEFEKLAGGWDPGEARQYAQAVATYLAMALAKYANYTCIGAAWDYLKPAARYMLAVHGYSLSWNFPEVNPAEVQPSGIGSFLRNVLSTVRALDYIIRAVGNSPTKVRVLLGDATRLEGLDGEKFTAVITDPPYAGEVDYTELSDFLYVWLKRALSDSDGLFLRPRFYPEAFFPGGREMTTQWEHLSLREINANAGRLKWALEHGKLRFWGNEIEYFTHMLAEALSRAADLLDDDGVIATYYASNNIDSWVALMKAGWRGAGLTLTAGWALTTEPQTRIAMQNAKATNLSAIFVWRKAREGAVDFKAARGEAEKYCSEQARKFKDAGHPDYDVYVAALACLASRILRGTSLNGINDVDSLLRRYLPTQAERITRQLFKAPLKK